MLQLGHEEFERLVIDELDLLPDDMVDGLDNVIFVVEDRPEDGELNTLGLYDGVALTERGQYGFGEMPDRIVGSANRSSSCAPIWTTCATRCTSPSCMRSRTSTASTTTGCTTSVGDDLALASLSK